MFASRTPGPEGSLSTPLISTSKEGAVWLQVRIFPRHLPFPPAERLAAQRGCISDALHQGTDGGLDVELELLASLLGIAVAAGAPQHNSGHSLLRTQ